MLWPISFVSNRTLVSISLLSRSSHFSFCPSRAIFYLHVPRFFYFPGEGERRMGFFFLTDRSFRYKVLHLSFRRKKKVKVKVEKTSYGSGFYHLAWREKGKKVGKKEYVCAKVYVTCLELGRKKKKDLLKLAKKHSRIFFTSVQLLSLMNYIYIYFFICVHLPSTILPRRRVGWKVSGGGEDWIFPRPLKQLDRESSLHVNLFTEKIRSCQVQPYLLFIASCSWGYCLRKPVVHVKNANFVASAQRYLRYLLYQNI